MPAISPAAEARLGRLVMGTVLQIAVVADDGAGAQAAAEEAFAVATRWDDVLTTWRPEGELARLDARAGSGPVPISAELATALRAMERLHEATKGAFDPAVGPLVEWWREGGPGTSRPKPGGPHRWPEAIRLRDRSAALAVGAAIDAGGVGKGIACDAILAALRARGVRAAFVDFGRSSLSGYGVPPEDPRGWTIAVAGLRPGESHGILRLRDESISTSRTIAVGDEAGSIVDPRTGEVVRAARLAVVLAADATTAEGWSTALVVLGRNGLAAIERAGLSALFEDETGSVLTAGFERRLERGSVNDRERSEGRR